MPESPDKLLKKARRAYQSGDRGLAAHLIDKILRQDYTHRGAWKLLYKEYGSGQPFKAFQIEFTEQYYPDKLDILTGGAGGKPISPVESRSWLSRISRGRTLRSEAGEITPESPGTPREPSDDLDRPTFAGDTPTRPIERKVAMEGMELEVKTSPPVPEQPSAPIAEIPAPGLPEPSTEIRSPPLPRPISGDKSQRIRVLIVDDTPQTRETIARSLSFQPEIEIIATAENGAQAIDLAKQTQPDVVLMDVNMPDMDGISATASVLGQVPHVQVIILTVQNDPDYLRKAMMAGAHDFLSKPPGLDDLLNAVLQAGRVAHQEKWKASQIQFKAGGYMPAKASQGKIITVYSPKGGVGCTTIATNLAATLHNEETNVVVVDANFEFGDVTDFFNLQSAYTIFDLAMRVSDLDYQIVDEILSTHESGIRILAPPGPEQAEYIQADQFIEILQFLRDLYPYVLVNTTSRLSDTTIAALEIADIIILPLIQDIPTVTRIRKFIDALQLLQINPERIMVVLNQYDKNAELAAEVISKSIKREFDLLIPKDLQIVLPSVNRGVPFMLRGNFITHPVSKSYLDLAEKIRLRLFQLAQPSLEAETDKTKPG